METPTTRKHKPIRQPTPRLSARKKSLFATSTKEDNVDYLADVKPFDCEQDMKQGVTLEKYKHVGIEKNLVSSQDESESSDDQLQELLSSHLKQGFRNQNTLHKTTTQFRKKKFSNENKYTYNTSPIKNSQKRSLSKTEIIEKHSYKREPTKSNRYNTKAISPRNFYSINTSPLSEEKLYFKKIESCKKSPQTARHHHRKLGILNKGVSHKIKRPATPRIRVVDTERILENIQNEKLRQIIKLQREKKNNIDKVHSILRTANDPIQMAKPLSSLSNYDDTLDNNKLDSSVSSHENQEHYLDFSDIEYDEEENQSVPEEKEDIIPLIRFESNSIDGGTTNKKFFKSGSTGTRKEVTITDNIKAFVHKGKLSLPPNKQIRRRNKIKNPVTHEFSDEQASVEAILKDFNNYSFGDVHETDAKDSLRNVQNLDCTESVNADYLEFRNRLPYKTSDPEEAKQQHLLLDFLINNNICSEDNFRIFIAEPENNKTEAARIVNEVVLVIPDDLNLDQSSEIKIDSINYDINSMDTILKDNPLDIQEAFNQDCTKKTLNQNIFTAIIMNSDSSSNNAENNHMETNVSKNDKIPVMPTELEYDLNATKVNTKSSSKCLEENNFSNSKMPDISPEKDSNSNIIKQKLFPIFCGEQCQPLKPQWTCRSQSLRISIGSKGINQYQIDVGQKDFGSQQCKHCGLVYSMHELEEEEIHRDYHSSLHVLRFNGWIDEDTVGVFREWGSDGRIIRLSEGSNVKRRERLTDILKIIDKELGFSSYILPKIFMAYFAVRRHQIVGLCLVQPLEKAYKYVNIDGVDLCTKMEFPAKCGISRLWVAPLHRRLHIASKLFHAVRTHTIPGEEIPLDKIAFSSPTEYGRMFAKAITNNEHFLVYQ